MLQKKAAKKLRLGVRQIKRLCKNYRNEGRAEIVRFLMGLGAAEKESRQIGSSGKG
jgi:hypothetical protein